METILSWVGAALGALLVVAVAVAWWEHLVRSSRPPSAPETVPPRVVSVDVQLDALPAGEAPPAAGVATAVSGTSNDAVQRRATLDSAMSRMARASQDSSAWTETTPMVLHAPTDLPSKEGGAAADADINAVSAPAPVPSPAPAATRA